LDVEKIRTVDIDVINEVLAVTQNIVGAYKEAKIHLKKAYLHFFFKRFLIKNKKIVEVECQPVIAVLQQANRVILSTSWLENRNFNITKQLACIIKTFEDFRLVAQIREEIEKVKPALIYAA